MTHGNPPSHPQDPNAQPSPGPGPAQPYGSEPTPPPAAPRSGGPGAPGGPEAPTPYGAPYGPPQGAPSGPGTPYGAPAAPGHPGPGGPQGPGDPYGGPGGAPYGAPGGAPTQTTVVPDGPQAVGPDGEPLLSQPLYGAAFMQAMKRYFKKYARFSGYASLSEYWWSFLGTAIIAFVALIPVFIGMIVMIGSAATYDPDSVTSGSGASAGVGAGGLIMIIGYVLALLVSVALIVPSLAVGARRLHDGGFSALFLLLHLLPSVGSLIVLILMFMPTKIEARRAEWDDVRGD